MAAFHLAVMPWCERSDLLVTDTEPGKRFFKEGKRFLFAAAHLVCEFKAVVRLHAFNGKGKFLYYMFKKLRRRIGALLFKCLQIPKPAVFIDKSVLIEFFFRYFSRQTSARHIFHIVLTLRSVP